MAHSRLPFHPPRRLLAPHKVCVCVRAVVCAAVVMLFAFEAPAVFAQGQGDAFWTEKPLKAAPVSKETGAFRKMVKVVGPAVVNIEVTIARKGGVFSGERRDLGQGSGFIITSDGYVLTNRHVIADATEIAVLLDDNRRFNARIIGSDESTDVALIKLEGARKLPVLSLGDSDQIDVGEWVVAIGSPLGLRSTVTAGIVSAMGRRDVKPGEGHFYSNFIQTDASINPGNSGGPLLNMRGEVIGINTAINRLGQGIGFAIPINMVKSILPELKTKGFVERSWMGIAIQALDRNLARSFGLNKPHGALVTSVDPRGPAASAGLKDGDIILSFNGHNILSSDELPWAASVAGVGRTVALKVWRDGSSKLMKMTLVAMPNQRAARPPEAESELAPSPVDSGIEVRDQSDPGVFVTRIDEGSPAEVSGLRAGDVVVEIGGSLVKDSKAFRDALKASRGALVRLKVQRLGAIKYFAFPTP